MLQTEAGNLRSQVGILTARDFILVNFRRTRLELRFVVLVNRTNRAPVRGNLLQTVDIHAGSPLGEFQRCYSRIERRLARQTGHAVKRRIDDIHASHSGHHQRSPAVAAGIVGM